MIIIGHRGACGYEAENTIRSFEKAIELGADYVELDVQKTLDDEIVVFHDKRLPDKTLIEDITLLSLKKELMKVRINVPTLDEVLEFIKGRIGVNIEIKSRMPAGLIKGKIKNYKCDLDKVIVSSFMHDLLLEIKTAAPNIKTGVLLESRPLDPFNILNKLKSSIIIQNHEFVDKDYIDMVHDGNAEIFVWTVNEPEDIKKMMDLGVDGIISDFPDRIKLRGQSPKRDRASYSGVSQTGQPPFIGATMEQERGNLFEGISKQLPKEVFSQLLETGKFRLERIVSQGQSTSKGEWLEQDQNEWVVLLSGAAILSFEKDVNQFNMKPGDYLHIPEHCKHRVEWTDPKVKTVWLALHY